MPKQRLKKQEARMAFKKILMISILISMVMLTTINSPCAQAGSEKIFSFSGYVEQLSPDLRYIVVNEAKILLLSNTLIVNAKSETLIPVDLKRGLYVTIEAIRNPNGISAKKITIQAANTRP